MTIRSGLALAMLSLWSCSTPAAHPPALGSGNGYGTAGGGANDGGAEGGGADGGAGPLDFAAYAGNVGYVFASSDSAGAASYSAAYARFVPSGDPDGCTNTPIAQGCRKSVCPSLSPPRTDLLSVGTVTIAGGLAGAITLSPGADNDYAHQAPGAVWWNGGEKSLPVGKFDLAFAPQINEFNGRRAVQLKVLDWRAA